MDNPRIAAALEQLADLLELKGENPFRVRSYRAAARAIDDLPRAAAEMVRAGEDLKKIKGVGEGMARRVKELVETGKCADLEKARASLPPGLPELLRIPGLGPKKAREFHEQLGVDSVDRLEKAARAGKLRELFRMGAKSEENILKGIAAYRRGEGRFRLNVGREYAGALVEHVRAVKGVKSVEAAGSLRRRRDSIGDVDILAVCADHRAVMERFVAFPEVAEILAQGETKSSVRLENGLQADLRVVDEDQFGAALHYFTGSKAHNIAVRDRAKDRGLKVNEYGVFRVEDEQRLGGQEEADVFRLIELDWIPPELRENRGEIEAAAAGKLPRLVELADIRGDLQAHSTATDGRQTAAEMARAAQARGYEYFALTDHSQAVRVAGGLNDEQLLAHLDQIERAGEKLKGCRLLKGVEVDILADGSLDLKDATLKECDIVVASIHSRFNLPAKEMTARIVKALKNRWVNILGHPTGRLLLEREPYALELEEVLKAAAGEGVCLEINAHPSRLDLNDVQARAAKEAGAKLVVNTDAHSAEQLGLMEYGVWTARRAWLEKEDVANALPLKEFLAAVVNR